MSPRGYVLERGRYRKVRFPTKWWMYRGAVCIWWYCGWKSLKAYWRNLGEWAPRD